VGLTGISSAVRIVRMGLRCIALGVACLLPAFESEQSERAKSCSRTGDLRRVKATLSVEPLGLAKG